MTGLAIASSGVLGTAGADGKLLDGVNQMCIRDRSIFSCPYHNTPTRICQFEKQRTVLALSLIHI